MELLEKMKSIKIVSIVLIVIFLVGYFYQQQSVSSTVQLAQLESEMTDEIYEETEVKTTVLDKLYVDVKGAVVRPGVYQLPVGSRVIDAIDAAGGLLEGADELQINQALLLTDQMMLVIHRKGEMVASTMADQVVQNPTSMNQKLININSADVSELTSLSGIGIKKAEAIIQYRNDNGSFQSVEELKDVKGIGDKIFEQLSDQVTVQ